MTFIYELFYYRLSMKAKKDNPKLKHEGVNVKMIMTYEQLYIKKKSTYNKYDELNFFCLIRYARYIHKGLMNNNYEKHWEFYGKELIRLEGLLQKYVEEANVDMKYGKLSYYSKYLFDKVSEVKSFAIYDREVCAYYTNPSNPNNKTLF